jgi:PAS domain S-box-containing protein
MKKEVNIQSLEELIKLQKPEHGQLIKSAIDVICSLRQEKKELEHQLTSFYNTIPMGFVEFDNDFNVTFWNKAAQKIFGYSANEMIGKNVFDTIVPEYERPKVLKVHDKDNPMPVRSLNDNITKYGIKKIDWYNFTKYNLKGQVIGFKSLFFDDSNENRIEQPILHDLIDFIKIRDNHSEFLESIHQGISEILDATNFCVGIYNKKKDELKLLYCSNNQKNPSDFNQTFMSYIGKETKSVLINNQNYEAFIKKNKIKEDKKRPQSWIGTPFIYNKQPSIVAVQSFVPNFSYTPGNKEALYMIGTLIGLGLEHIYMKNQLKI